MCAESTPQHKARRWDIGLQGFVFRTLGEEQSKYVNLLQDYSIRISMTEDGDPLEDAIAERINGILKDEYLSHYQIQNIQEAKRELNKAIIV